MGILKDDKKSRKRKRDQSTEEQNLNKNREDGLTKDVDLLSPEQKSAKKRKKSNMSNSFTTAEVETPVKRKVEKLKVKTPVQSVDNEDKTKKKKNKENKDESLSSPILKKGKRNKKEVLSIEEDKASEKGESIKAKKNIVKNKGVSEDKEPEKGESIKEKKKRVKKEKNDINVPSVENDKQLETEESTKTKKKKNKKEKRSLSFGVVDSNLLEKSGGKTKNETEISTERPSRINRAVDYLRLWKNDRKSWKFNKGFQSLLLKAIYNPVIIDEDDFETSLLYFEDSQGGAREKLRTDAMALIKDDDHLAEPVDEDMERRAREIIQMLG